MRVGPENGPKSGEIPRLYRATLCKKPLPYESERSLQDSFLEEITTARFLSFVNV